MGCSKQERPVPQPAVRILSPAEREREQQWQAHQKEPDVLETIRTEADTRRRAWEEQHKAFLAEKEHMEKQRQQEQRQKHERAMERERNTFGMSTDEAKRLLENFKVSGNASEVIPSFRDIDPTKAFSRANDVYYEVEGDRDAGLIKIFLMARDTDREKEERTSISCTWKNNVLVLSAPIRTSIEYKVKLLGREDTEIRWNERETERARQTLSRVLEHPKKDGNLP
jgi:hypothetical protein